VLLVYFPQFFVSIFLCVIHAFLKYVVISRLPLNEFFSVKQFFFDPSRHAFPKEAAVPIQYFDYEHLRKQDFIPQANVPPSKAIMDHAE
jgi:hypothetical protein